MARESKGKQVKTFKHGEPQPDLTMVEKIGKVYFEADTGNFCIYLPAHIGDMGDMLPGFEKDFDTRGVNRRKGQVYGKTMDGVLAAHRKTLKDFVSFLRTAKREKVIDVSFSFNLRWIEEFHKTRKDRHFAQWNGSNRDGISFAGNPALHLTYAVLYRVGDELFDVIHPGREDEYMSYKRKAGGRTIVWTEEREAFFAQTVGNIERLIMAIITFMDDMEGSIDKAIAAGGLMALPAPKSEA